MVPPVAEGDPDEFLSEQIWRCIVGAAAVIGRVPRSSCPRKYSSGRRAGRTRLRGNADDNHPRPTHGRRKQGHIRASYADGQWVCATRRFGGAVTFFPGTGLLGGTTRQQLWNGNSGQSSANQRDAARGGHHSQVGSRGVAIAACRIV